MDEIEGRRGMPSIDGLPALRLDAEGDSDTDLHYPRQFDCR
jgi:hypothetical protein